MKTFILIGFFLINAGYSIAQPFYVYTARGSGPWNNVNNWNIAPRTDGVPRNRVIIPSGFNIVADNNVNSLGLGHVDILVAGRLTVQANTTINLGANSTIELAGGQISGNANTQRIRIGTVVKYNGSLDLTKTGFSYANSSTGISPNGFQPSSILPVNFVSFTAMRLHNNVNQLTWQVTNEENNRQFSVEKSSDGQQWKQIARIAPAVSQGVMNTYQYIDNSSAREIVYYRIAQEDMDGSVVYSAISSILPASAESNPRLYTSGSNSIVVEPGGSYTGSLKISVVSLSGQVIYSDMVEKQSRISVRVNRPMRGVHIVRLEQPNGNSYTGKINL